MAEITRPEASYRHVPQPDGMFGVEITIAGTNPTIVTSFASPEAADVWIEGHRARSLLPMFRGRFRSRQAKPA